MQAPLTSTQVTTSVFALECLRRSSSSLFQKMRVVVAFLWAMAWAVWALEEGGVGSLYDQHFPPLHPNCTQSLTDLLLLRQELQLRELKEVEQVSAEILKEILTDIRSFLTRNRTSTEASCPSNFRKFGENCLYLHKDTDLTWEGARLFCQNLGGDLVVFRDANALAEALAYTKGSGLSSSANVWAGGSDIAVEGEWKWVTGEDMPRGTPFQQHPGASRRSRGELCYPTRP